MQQGFSARQLGYEFVPIVSQESQLHIKKIESVELNEIPSAKKSESQNSSNTILADKLSQVPIWKQLMACGFSQQFYTHPSQYGYNGNPQGTNYDSYNQMNTHSYPPSNNHQVPFSYGQQYNSYSYGHQYPANQQQNPSYQSNNSNQYTNQNSYQNQSPKKDSSNLKTGFNLINKYNNNQNSKKQSSQGTIPNPFDNGHSHPNPHNYPFISPPNQYSPTKQTPMSKSHEYHETYPQKIRNKQSIEQFAMNKKQKMAWNDWNTILDRIKHSINADETQGNLVTNAFWDWVLNKVQPYFLNKKNTIEFFHLLKDYFNIDPEHSSFDALKFFKKFGEEFDSFETNLFFQHKSCLEYAKFISVKNIDESGVIPVRFLNLTFNMTNQETLSVAKTVFKLCQHDLDAFSFLSLYLIVSIQKGLTLESYDLVEQEFIKMIALLDQQYPASSAESFSSNLFDPDVKIKYEKPKIQFKSSNPRENFKDLQNFVFQKVNRSRYDEFKFRKLVQNVCLKHGYNFKLGHKIKLDNNQYAMLRTIEKILEDILPKYKEKISQANERIIDTHKQKQSQNGILHTIVRTQIEVVSQVMGEILTNQKSVEFNIKDLLRAKCSFSSVYAIKQALCDLKSSILSFPDCQIIETKNNLSKRTRDFAVIIKLPNCIAELQLVLNLNSIPNQFNHKIYEMRRTKLFSPVTNLYLCHNKWSQKFFRKFMELHKHVSKSQVEPKIEEDVSFKEFKEDTKIFKKIVSHFSQLNKERLKQIKETSAKDIQKEFDQLNQVIYKNNEKMHTFTDEQRRINEIQFFISAKECTKAKEYFEKIGQTEIQNNPVLLQQYTEILFQNQDFGKCLEESLKLLNICSFPPHNLKIIKKIGDIYLYLPDLYEKALEQYLVALEILHQNQRQQVKNEKYKSKNSDKITQADLLNSIGAVYLKQKILDKAQQKFIQSQTLYKKNKNGNTIQMASTYVNIGRLMQAQQKFKQAEDNYKASLEIIQKYKGKYSVEAGNVLRRLCSAYLGMGKMKNYEEALDCARKAYDIAEHVLGKNDTETKKCLDLIEKCKAQMQVGELLMNLSVDDQSEGHKLG